MKKFSRSDLLEINCYKRLKSQNETSTFKWSLMGGSDSTVSDIMVKNIKTNKTFFVEVKDVHASQGAQFTVYPDKENKKFIHTGSHQTRSSLKIVDFMSQNFEAFANPTTSGIALEGIQDLLRSHFIEHYRYKKAKFIALTNGVEDRLVELSELPFDKLTAKYRIIGNGSSHVSSKNMNEAKSLMRKGISCMTKKVDGKTRLYVKSNSDIGGTKIKGKKITYMVSEKNILNGVWHEVRQLSSSYSPTVILTF